jgi:hypothetical protein
MSRLFFRTSCLALLVALLPHALQAQDFTLPTTGVIPNYDRVAIGQAEALEGGAYVARTNDAGANWYNPAGLVQVEKVSLNAAASGYELTKTSLEGLGTEASRTRFTPVGRYFGLVVGNPVVKGRDVRLAISFSRPVGWDPGVIETSIAFTPAGGGTETIGYNSLVSFSTAMPTLGAGFRISDQFRLGASATLAITNFGVAQLVSDRLLVGTTSEAISRIVTIDGSTKQFVFAGGAQWEPTRHLRVGAQVRSPGLAIGGNATVVLQRTQFGAGGTDDLAFRDPEATFRYKIPLNIVGGVAWVDSAWALEVNVRYHGGVSAYDMVSSDLTGQRVVVPPAAPPIVTQAAFAPVVEEARSVVNLAIGGSVRISRTFRLHAGFFTDESPVGNPQQSIFRELDLVGGAIGASLTVGRLSGSLGFTASTGSSGPQSIASSLSGTTTETRLKVTTAAFIYALSYNF